MRYDIVITKTDAEIERCFPVMRELRPHLGVADFAGQVKRQMAQGWHMAFLQTQGEVRAVTGYRISENLAWGKFLYVDDLVTKQTDRSKGYGAALLDWLRAEAIRQGCRELHLDSGVQRFGAHRFYLGRRMDITSHHFAMKLAPKTDQSSNPL